MLPSQEIGWPSWAYISRLQGARQAQFPPCTKYAGPYILGGKVQLRQCKAVGKKLRGMALVVPFLTASPRSLDA